MDAIGGIADEIIQEAAAPKKKRRARLRYMVLAAAAAMLCLTVSVSALTAADVGAAYQLLYAIAPDAAQRLKPVRQSCTDNGIRMEVVSAQISGDTAELLVAMQDLEGKRVDETIDLFDSYSIRSFSDSVGTCRKDAFDPETGTAMFRITLQQMNGREIRGEKVTFSVSRFLSGKQTFTGVIPGLDLTQAQLSPALLENVSARGSSGVLLEEQYVMLRPNDTPLARPVPGAAVTAMGYADGLLHVQVCYADILETDNHGWVYLMDAQGNVQNCVGNVAFWSADRTDSYEEYLFDVPYDALGNYALHAELTTAENLTEGCWQVTFPLERDTK